MKYKRVEGFVIETGEKHKGREFQFCRDEHERRLAEMVRGLNDQDAKIVIETLKQKYGTGAVR